MYRYICDSGAKFQFFLIGRASSQQFIRAHTHSFTMCMSSSFFLQIPSQGHMGTCPGLQASPSLLLITQVLLFSSWHMCNKLHRVQAWLITAVTILVPSWHYPELCSVGPVEGETLRSNSQPICWDGCKGLWATSAPPDAPATLFAMHKPISLWVCSYLCSPQLQMQMLWLCLFSGKPFPPPRCQDVSGSSVSQTDGSQNEVPG